MPQKSATNIGAQTGTRVGLGNRRSIRLSYGANGSFPRFPPLMGQGDDTQTRRKGLGMAAQGAAQLIWAAKMLRDCGFTHVEALDGSPISIADQLGLRMFELIEAATA